MGWQLIGGVVCCAGIQRRSCVSRLSWPFSGLRYVFLFYSLTMLWTDQRRIQASWMLEACVEGYTCLEILKDCIWRKCSIVTTHHRLLWEVLTLEEATKPEAKPFSSKKHRLKEVKRMEARVKSACFSAWCPPSMLYQSASWVLGAIWVLNYTSWETLNLGWISTDTPLTLLILFIDLCPWNPCHLWKHPV